MSLKVEYLGDAEDPKTRVVILDYNEISKEDADFSDAISEAFGFDGLGILTVKGVPNVENLRQNILPLAHKFASLPEEIKLKTEHKESFYSFGWSFGKEMMREGKPDYSKGSYYANPSYDFPFDDPELIKKYPAFCHPNIWPKEDLPELEPAFKQMGQLVVEVGLLVARQCDKYVQKQCSTYTPNRLFNVIKNSKTCKARLLHYFPLEESNQSPDPTEENMTWCGWHNDHGSLTGLVPAMFMDAKGNQVSCPDSKAGLYIYSRNGKLVRVSVPSSYLAFQIGETAQIHSGGILQATPHAVRGSMGPQSHGISRETLAVFMEPMWNEKMDIPLGLNSENVKQSSTSKFLPVGVPLLDSRWTSGEMDFGQFTEVTLKSYY